VAHDLDNLKPGQLKMLSQEDKLHITERWAARWKMMHSPFHAAGYLLSPAHMDDRKAMDDQELAFGFKQVVEKLVPDVEEQLQIMSQMEMFRSGEGAWNSPLIKAAKTLPALKFWNMFGYITPSLKQLALKVLSVAVTSCAAERNW
jgi:hypothetical protein